MIIVDQEVIFPRELKACFFFHQSLRSPVCSLHHIIMELLLPVVLGASQPKHLEKNKPQQAYRNKNSYEGESFLHENNFIRLCETIANVSVLKKNYS